MLLVFRSHGEFRAFSLGSTGAETPGIDLKLGLGLEFRGDLYDLVITSLFL